jgi:hypothetical protein
MKLLILCKNYYKTIIWVLIMLYILFSPPSAIPKTGLFNLPHFDKFVHFTMFAALVFLFRIESAKSYPLQKIRRNLFLILFIFFAGLSEVIQYEFIAGRSGSIHDFFADMVGFTAGTLLYLWLWKKLSLRFGFLQKL